MAGFTKAVVGSIHYKSVDIEQNEFDQTYQVSNMTSGILTAPDVMTISPRTGNIHELKFIENTIMFDIFIPNYGEGRDCNYYSFLPNSKAALVKDNEPNINFREHPFEGPLTAV
mmetsp:Transcript_34242/g.59942  ORF Transcript_34242/g.59942 Transcript_34242/m.59942 type:complete len:114 (-) Transcript_34242:4680-5021(-)